MTMDAAVGSDHTPVILVVDDNPHNLQLVAVLLGEQLGCDLSFAGSAAEALEVLAEVTPDLILLDVNMPEKDGFQLCAELRQREITSEVPVIFLTAQQDTKSIVRGFEVGGNDYVTKPFESQELLARVRTQLTLKLRTDQLKTTIARIKRLEGIIPICMYCKKIRDDSQSWQQLERYICEHSEAIFSHGICPDCYEQQSKAFLALKRKKE